MFYLTFNDSPSGVYYSQVIETVNYLNTLNQRQVKLIAVIPVRNFKANKKKLKSWHREIIVLPIPFKLKYWKKTRFLLKLIPGITSERIIARGPLACSIALTLSQNVIYDGRAAVSAELDEFPDMVRDQKLVNEIKLAEKEAVLNSALRIAVSKKLVDYWKEKFGYTKSDHFVIPCLISEQNSTVNLNISREDLGFKKDDIVLVFSGGTGGWQSSELLLTLLNNQLIKENIKLLLLSKETPEFIKLKEHYNEKVVIKWVEPKHVFSYLKLGDYGILLRDQIITNKVASPVKFAEYLSAGLKVLISPNLGDYSELVVRHKIGHVLDDDTEIDLQYVSNEEKNRLIDFAKNELSRNNYKDFYCNLFRNKKTEN